MVRGGVLQKIKFGIWWLKQGVMILHVLHDLVPSESDLVVGFNTEYLKVYFSLCFMAYWYNMKPNLSLSIRNTVLIHIHEES